MGIKQKRTKSEKESENEFEQEILNFNELSLPQAGAMKPLNQSMKKSKKKYMKKPVQDKKVSEDNIDGASSNEDEDQAELDAYLSNINMSKDDQDDDDDDDDALKAVYYENKTVALLEKMSNLAQEYSLTTPDFKDHMVMDAARLATIPSDLFTSAPSKNEFVADKLDPHDDLSREDGFMQQAMQAAIGARYLLVKAGVAFSRPGDYFAEMIKSDSHMEKVRTTLLNEEEGIKKSEQARQQRHLKKFGKQVQVERIKERQADKKRVLEKVSSLRKKNKDSGGGAVDVDFDVEAVTADEKKPKSSTFNKTRVKKNQKYGFGGAKRHAKSNTKDSTNDISSFNLKKMKGSNSKHSSSSKKGFKKSSRK